MKGLTYIEHGKFALQEKAKPQLVSARDAKRRNVLRRMLLLQEGLCQQLHRSSWRLGAWLPH